MFIQCGFNVVCPVDSCVFLTIAKDFNKEKFAFHSTANIQIKILALHFFENVSSCSQSKAFLNTETCEYILLL